VIAICSSGSTKAIASQARRPIRGMARTSNILAKAGWTIRWAPFYRHASNAGVPR